MAFNLKYPRCGNEEPCCLGFLLVLAWAEVYLENSSKLPDRASHWLAEGTRTTKPFNFRHQNGGM